MNTALLDELRARWEGGDQVVVESLVGDLAIDRELLLDLIYEEYRLRLEAGQSPQTEHFRQRFSQVGFEIETLVELHHAFESALPALGELPADGKSTLDVAAVVGDRFEIRERLGQGTFAEVWRGWDQKLHRDVAVKIPKRLGHPWKQGVLKEARAAAGLLHPNIVPVYEAADQVDVPHLVTAYIPGGSLRDALRAERIDSQAAISICRDIAGAVAFAHKHNIIHRDLKPANILLDADLKPYIADFGLARGLLSDESDHLVGTPAYMAPEQVYASSQAIDGRADIYALGVILCELCCGKRPSEPQERNVTIEELIRSGVRRDIAVVCAGCLRRRPEERYANAEILANDLTRIISGRAPRYSPALSASQKALEVIRRAVIRLSVPAVACLAAAVASAAILYFQMRPKDPNAPREIVIDTKPSRAEVVFIRRSKNDGEPLYNKGPAARGIAPFSAKLTPGDYLVAVKYSDGNIQEVFRHVPQWNEVGQRYNAYQSWKMTSGNIVELPRVSWPTTAIDSTELANHDGLLYCSRPTDSDARLDPPKVIEASAGQERVFRYDDAVRRAESLGMRLPTDAEWTRLFESSCLASVAKCEWTCNYLVLPDTPIDDPAGYHRSIFCRTDTGFRMSGSRASHQACLRLVRCTKAFSE